MSIQNKITAKNTIKSTVSTDKNISKQTKQFQNSNNNVHNSSKLIQKVSLALNQNHQRALNHDSTNNLKVDVSLNNVQENMSDLHSFRFQEQIKSTLHQNTNLKHQKQEQNLLQKSNISNFSQFTFQDSQTKSYFSQFNQFSNQTNPINKHQKSMFETLKKQITNGKLLIKQTRPFPLKKKQQKINFQEEKQIKSRLQEKRQQALMKIRQIEEQELQLKRRAVSTLERPRRNGQFIDKEEIKKALQEYKKFTQEMQKRQQQVQEQRQQQHKLQVQRQQEIMRLRRQSRRQQVKHNLKQIVEREKVRKSILQEWKAKEKEIKNKKYLYIEYKQKYIKEEGIREMQHHQILGRIRKNHEFDKEVIEQHQRKYEEHLEQRREMSRSMISSAVTHSSSMKKYEKSIFHESIVREMQQKKKKQLHKLMKVKENQHNEKIHRYQEMINNEIKPNLHYKKFVPLPRAMSLQALQPKDRWNLGLKYLQKAKKLKMPETQLKLLLTKRQESDKLKLFLETNSYKDYLQEMKQDIKYDPTEKKLGEILKNKRSYSNYQTLKDAKYMSEYLVAKSKHSDQQKTMLAIKKKMDILNAIY